MNEYHYYQVEGESRQLKKCEGCERLTSALYCCPACETAHAGRFEIHESGPLSHSDTCDQRNTKRQNLRPLF